MVGITVRYLPAGFGSFCTTVSAQLRLLGWGLQWIEGPQQKLLGAYNHAYLYELDSLHIFVGICAFQCGVTSVCPSCW